MKSAERGCLCYTHDSLGTEFMHFARPHYWFGKNFLQVTRLLFSPILHVMRKTSVLDGIVLVTANLRALSVSRSLTTVDFTISVVDKCRPPMILASSKSAISTLYVSTKHVALNTSPCLSTIRGSQHSLSLPITRLE